MARSTMGKSDDGKGIRAKRGDKCGVHVKEPANGGNVIPFRFKTQGPKINKPKNGSCCDETPPMLRQAQHERFLKYSPNW